MKTALREVISKYNLSIRLTPNQNIILCDIRNAWKRPVTTTLAQAGLLVSLLDLYKLWLLANYFLSCKVYFTTITFSNQWK